MWFLDFPAEPPLPPSNAQANLRQNKEEFNTKEFFLSIKKLFQNKPFVIHMVAYGINIAVFSAVGTFLSQFVLQYFQVSIAVTHITKKMPPYLQDRFLKIMTPFLVLVFLRSWITPLDLCYIKSNLY